MTDSSSTDPKLSSAAAVIDKCTECGACRARCAFLKKYGMPSEIAGRALQGDASAADPYECSLCGLCSVACPEGLNISGMFLDMRRKAVADGRFDSGPYSPVLKYEALGSSPLFSLLRLPSGGDTVFFPGCALPSTRPAVVRRLFTALSECDPSMGICLGCCLKPSHDLGRDAFFEEKFGRLLSSLTDAGVKRVITACPNCQKIFEQYGTGLTVETVYMVLDAHGHTPDRATVKEAVIHDPCPQREDSATQDSVRSLAARCGISIREMKNKRRWTQCCGEGGMVKFACPELADTWTDLRKEGAEGQPIVTSCAGCANYLGGVGEVHHILDLLFGGTQPKWLKPPLTYAARLLLKRYFRRLPQWG